MFGLSFAELTVVVIVAIVVIGPKDLPKVLRKLGQWSGKLRRMAFDLRAQSGIDEVLHAEGLGADIHEIRKLARGELDGVMAAARFEADTSATPASTAAEPAAPYAHAGSTSHSYDVEVPRHREYPREGADAYNALPDGAVVYADTPIPSPFATDPTYTCGIELPPPPAEIVAVPETAAVTAPGAATGAATVEAPVATPLENAVVASAHEPELAPAPAADSSAAHIAGGHAEATPVAVARDSHP